VQGQGEAGLVQLHQGMAAVFATGNALSRVFCLVLLAEAAGHAGQVEERLRIQPAHLITGAYGESCSARPRVVSQNNLSDSGQRENGLRYARLTRFYSIQHEGACNGGND
jgi:hypothetical protein